MLGLGRFIFVVLLTYVITIDYEIIVLLCQELSQHLLDVVQDFLLALEVCSCASKQ